MSPSNLQSSLGCVEQVLISDMGHPRASQEISFECRTGCLLFGLLLLFVSIVNFLSQREESGLQRTIIFRVLHDANRYLTLMFTTDCYLRGHVTLDCKSPEPVCFVTEETLGMLFVPTVRMFPDKVCNINCTEE
jgi:hypothetical protein